MRTILIVGGLALAGAAQAVPGGSYRQSCRDARDVGRNGLEAECRDMNGRYQQTRLNLSTCDGGDIGNDNGQLVCTAASGRPGSPGSGGGGRLPDGSWRQSCRGGEVSRGMLSAVCESAKGRGRETSISLSACPNGRFGNDNGRLVCE